MIKKFLRLVLVGVLGILVLPSIVNAGVTNFNIKINYEGGVSSDNFIVEYCIQIDDNGDCTNWTSSANKGNLSIPYKEYSEQESPINFVRISKNINISGYATKNYTLIYETAMTTVVDGVPINNFITDVGSGSRSVNSLEFKFAENDNVLNDTYVISVYPSLKSFGWNFDEDDSGIDNGTAELMTNESKSGNILIEIKEGDYQILPGTEVTIRLLPDSGYQLKKLELSGTNLSALQNVGYYKFNMPNNNLHFKTVFDTQENIIKRNSSLVSDANIAGDVIEKGNLKLSIEDITSSAIKGSLNAVVSDGTIAAYLDLSLANVIFKGTDEDVWSEQLTDLGEEVTITLELNSIKLDEDPYIVYEHDGQFHTISSEDIVYNEKDNTITFSTKQFSNYAIVSSGDKIKHSIKYGDNDEFVITFEDMVSGAYELEINSLLELLDLTDQELLDADIDASHEEIEEIFNNIKTEVSSKGNLVGLYEMAVVLLGNMKTDGPFTFKIKLTDELKKYNTFNMIYLDDEFNVSETVVKGTVKDGYIVFTLPHLSVYALTASNVVNPRTGDNIMYFILIGSVSLITLLGTSFYLKKKKSN